MPDFDSHNFCPTCRDRGKGDDVCVKEKPEDCYICLQFSAEQMKKLKPRKSSKKSKEETVSKEVEDSLLGVETTSGSVAASSASIGSATPQVSSDPLQQILAKLESMQGRIYSLEK